LDLRVGVGAPVNTRDNENDETAKETEYVRHSSYKRRTGRGRKR
jgi:hypothetical protein